MVKLEQAKLKTLDC